jgi:putative acetyltransferase
MHITRASFPGDLAAVQALFRLYADGLGIDLSFQNFEQELAVLPGLYVPPVGGIWLAIDNGDIAGCVGLRPFTTEMGEMKRLFVRPELRGGGVGRLLAEQAITAAKEFGYGRIVLDTLPSMAGAIELYKSLGFVEIEPYYNNPVAGAMFFGKDLACSGHTV